LEYDFKCPDCGSILEENRVDTKKYEEKLKFYKYWLEKIKKFAKEEERFDIEEIIERRSN
jgi:transcription initiation factor IIE alpha subunit